jgi:hypothetical protein
MAGLVDEAAVAIGVEGMRIDRNGAVEIMEGGLQIARSMVGEGATDKQVDVGRIPEEDMGEVEDLLRGFAVAR